MILTRAHRAGQKEELARVAISARLKAKGESSATDVLRLLSALRDAEMMFGDEGERGAEGDRSIPKQDFH